MLFASNRQAAKDGEVTDPTTRKARREATFARLITCARNIFGDLGYAATSLNAIVAKAGVTKGALYHHFPNGKPQLFEAVTLAEQRDLMAALSQTKDDGTEDALANQLSVYFDAATQPGVFRITMIDAPAVLGRKRWREIEYAHGGQLIEDDLSAYATQFEMLNLDRPMVAAALYGALSETTVMIAEAADKDRAKKDAIAVILSLCRSAT
jgi:AcrR family transcriptional regulator